MTVNIALQALAGQRNINIDDLAASNQITVATPQVGTVPQDSGYVNDPVCTATGHLLVDSRDFAMPARLDVLSFRRTYASRGHAAIGVRTRLVDVDRVPRRDRHRRRASTTSVPTPCS